MPEPTAHAPELSEKQAVAQFEKRVKEQPDAIAHFNLGSAYYVAHDYDHALPELQQALAASDNLYHAHYYLGVIFKARGEMDKAKQEFDKVLNGSANMMLKNQAKIQLQNATII